MSEHDWLTQRFAEHRNRLTGLAYKMLGSRGDAEDAVQEAWLRVNRADADKVENPAGWLTTVVARVCLNMLETRRARREEPAGAVPPDPAVPHANPEPAGQAGPEDEALLADSVGVALMVVLDTLTPGERLALVLHDVFDVPFGEIGAIIDRSPAAARQLASRARRRVQGAAAASSSAHSRKREIVAAFLAASRGGDFSALLALLDPGAVLVADPEAVRMGAPGEVRGADAVAAMFSGRAEAARPALVDGVPAAVWAYRGRPKVVFNFSITDGRITRIAMDAEPDLLHDLDIVFLSANDKGR
ncbi:sigma-70 family RNA polymerase sigma factor [Actinoallomurus rhizosphaericola]|uniref:sigma-70 family RNA polymerase sigma factor n=1 Tax=Actinoallomurus rhizosphaericola TaxID=2952536 RepID=UPI0020939A27|nr:sigma-70 family RNA polymerase sigma factor [Actinoallomurus rhizosphaericola]MCO5995407.1 sigma-70 family RNA polymerase sigma factor [Actinoallomurus rhizosphaericola]